MLRVGINGYGTIGKRVADAVRAQPDMAVVGVGKTSPDYVAERARALEYDLYAPAGRTERFETAGIDLAGTTEELVRASDVIVDATPGGIGAENHPLYADHDTPAVFQGAEEDALVDISFNARSNYEAAADAEYTRVVSCNTTGLCRLLTPLDEAYGVEKARVTLIRRGGDPVQSSRGPIDDILPDPVSIPSHHGPDVETVLPEIDIDTLGTKVPATHMHLHSVNVTLASQPEPAAVQSRLAEESRLFLIPEGMGIDGAGALKELARDAGRPRSDLWENCVWAESIAVEGNDLYCFQGIHQESDVVPENVDALRAMFGLADREESMRRTDEALGVGLSLDSTGRPRYPADEA